MKIEIAKKAIGTAAVFVLPVFLDKQSAPAELKKILENRKKKGDFKGKSGETLLIVPDDENLPEKILLIGFGDTKKLNSEKVRNLSAKIIKSVKQYEKGGINLWIPAGLNKFGKELGEGMALADYNPAKYVTGKSKEKNAKAEIKTVTLRPEKNDKKLLEVVMKGVALAEAVNYARDLVNGPNNFVNAETLSKEAVKVAKECGAKLTVLNKKQLEKLGMGALLGVNLGSEREARLVVMEYKPKNVPKKDKPVLLVGKGITFDSGGYNLKPTQGIANMKQDMAGAAAVLGTFKLLKKMGVKKHVIGITPLTDNLIGSKAQKVNDIVTAYNGKTVEITNTDAEGRLVLADAIAYGIKQYNPGLVIDIATLTGACMVALGDRYAGLLGNNQKLIDGLIKAGEDTGELVWHLPIHPDYRKAMKGKITDLINSEGSGLAGASKGAAFIQEFVGKTPWAHLDIGGMAFVKEPKPYDHKDATGYGVRLFMEFLN